MTIKMQLSNTNLQAFLDLVKAGLWEKECLIKPLGDVDYNEIYRFSQEQSVDGLVAAGLELVSNMRVPQNVALTYAGVALQLENRNKAMNLFIAELTTKLRKEGVYFLLVKGQGVAQCYERPLWRACGDVDLLLDRDNYKKAKEILTSVASHVDEEDDRRLHLALTINTWIVELHGTLDGEWSKKVDMVVANIQKESLDKKEVREWKNGNVEVALPAIDDDVLFVFTHILQHFFRGGIGLRQICDWCRLLWTYRDSLDVQLLEARLRKSGLMSEWKTFAALAVEYLGLPQESIPFYSERGIHKKKASKVLDYVMEKGNLGHNSDESFRKDKSRFFIKLISFIRNTRNAIKVGLIFPMDSLKAWWNMTGLSFVAVVKGK